MKKEELQEQGHGFIEFDPNKTFTDVYSGEERPEDSMDFVDGDRTKRSVIFLMAKFGYDEMTAREHLYNQGIDFDEVLWYEEAENNFESIPSLSPMYQFDGTK